MFFIISLLIAGGVFLGILTNLIVGIFVYGSKSMDNGSITKSMRMGHVKNKFTPYVIMVSVALTVAIIERFGFTWISSAYLAASLGLLAVSIVDLIDGRIPNRIIYPTFFITFLLMLIQSVYMGSYSYLERASLVGLVAGLFLLAIHLVSPSGMGMGDVRLEVVAGLIMGWQIGGVMLAMFGLLGSFAIASIVGVIKMKNSGMGRKTIIRFGPYLSLGAIVIMLFGQNINSYLSIN